MSRARVPYQYLSCLDVVASTAICRAGIHRVSVVDASADCVAFDDLDTHDGGCGNGLFDDKLLGRGRKGVC